MEKTVIRNLLLTCGSGLLVYACFPPLGCRLLVIIAWVPLLAATMQGNTRHAFYYGFLHGMIAYGLSLFWFTYIFQAGALGLYAILSGFTGLFCLLFNLACKKWRRPHSTALFASVCWTWVEFFRSELFGLRFTWITPGVALGPTWLSPFVGVYGGSFLIIYSSALMLFKTTRRSGIICGILLICLHFVGLPPVTVGKNPIRVTAVQSESSRFDRYYALTPKTPSVTPQLIVWPEHALPRDVRKEPDKAELEKIVNLSNDVNGIFVIGTRTESGNWPSNWFNTALTLDATGVLGEYYKHRPVHFFDDGLPGTRYNPIKTPAGNIGTPICFDNDYPDVFRKIVACGAELIAAPSYDAAWWSSVQHDQHSELFRLRAAENYRWVVCAASSGMSKIIDPHGNIRHSLPIREEGAISGDAEMIKQQTFYTLIGWAFPWLCLTGLISMLIIYIIDGPIRKGINH